MNLNQEQKAFLSALKKEMLEQDTCGQAAPRYWIIMEQKRQYGIAEGYEDGCELLRNGETVAESIEEITEFLLSKSEQIIAHSLLDDGEVEVKYFSFGSSFDINIRNKDGDEDYFGLDLDELKEFLEEIDSPNSYSLAFYKMTETPVQGPLFLTKKAAEEYQERYGYNHPKGSHPYALTAYRSPEIEFLWDLIQKTNWEDEA